MLDTGNFNHLASTAKRIGSGEFSLCLNEELMRFSDARSLALRRLGRRHDHQAVKQIRLQHDGASVEDSLAGVSMRPSKRDWASLEVTIYKSAVKPKHRVASPF